MTSLNTKAKAAIEEQLETIRIAVDKLHLEYSIPGQECRPIWFAIDEAKYQIRRISDE